MSDYDIVVLGNGPAAAAAALAAALGGARVLRLGSGQPRRVGESLAPPGNRALRQLGFARSLEADGHLVSHGTVALWGTEHPVETDFLLGSSGVGWQLDRARFDAGLQAHARAGGVEDAEDRAVDVLRAGERWELKRASAGSVRCRWLIDATGRSAWLARRYAPRVYDERLVAFVATYRSPADTDSDTRTCVEAAIEGWWYTSRAPGARRVVGLITSSNADARRRARGAGFERTLARTKHVGALRHAHSYAADGLVRASDASSCYLDAPTGNGWLAVGDAAIAVDPLASQGVLNAMHLGLRGGAAAAAHLGGDRNALAAYSEEVAAVRDDYLRGRAWHYQLEGRWPLAPFWKTRRLATAAEPERPFLPTKG